VARLRSGLLKAGPRVRIRLPPAESRTNRRFLVIVTVASAGVANERTADLPFNPTGKPRKKWCSLSLALTGELGVSEQHKSTTNIATTV
jgi:hypothetical protein